MKRILTAAIPVIMLSTILLSGCAAQSVEADPETGSQVMPPIDSVTVRTLDGNGIVTLVMRTYEDALSSEDIDEIKAYTQSLLGDEYNPGGPKITSSQECLGEARVVAFVYAVYTDRIPSPWTGTAGNENSVESVYWAAQEWFVQELAGIDIDQRFDWQ